MKTWYGRDAINRQFRVGDLVLVLLPVPGNPLQVSYIGPCKVLEKRDDVNYVVSTPERRKKTQICHINMLIAYNARQSNDSSTKTDDGKDVILTVTSDVIGGADQNQTQVPDVDPNFEVTVQPVRLGNSKVLENLSDKLGHLTTSQCDDLFALLNEFKDLFPDVPGRAQGMYHDVEVGDAKPIKQHPYRVGPLKSEIMRKEIDYMLENNIIEPCFSDWSSPCILQPKSDGSWRFCTDFRKVNNVTRTDCFPLPRISDLIDQVGKVQFLSKFDLLKGYLQIPLTERAKDISAFCTSDGLYRYTVTPFGMKNSGCTLGGFRFTEYKGVRG